MNVTLLIIMKRDPTVLRDRMAMNDTNDWDVHTLANYIIKTIINMMDEIAPIAKKVIPKKWMDKPWINDNVRSKSRRRDESYGRAKSSGEAVHWEEYRRCRNVVVYSIRESKRRYYEKSIDGQKINPRKM